MSWPVYPPWPTKRPTPEEYAVLAITVAVGCFAVGLLGLADYCFNPPADQGTLHDLWRLSWFALASGVVVVVGYKVARRLVS